jgi:hypothetical protein
VPYRRTATGQLLRLKPKALPKQQRRQIREQLKALGMETKGARMVRQPDGSIAIVKSAARVAADVPERKDGME